MTSISPTPQLVEVDKLDFDPLNPRLPLSLRGISNEDLIKYYILHENIFELMSSIAQQGYVSAEPLLVVSQSKERFVVVEGNRRLASLKLLNYPKMAVVKSSTVMDIIGNAAVDIPNRVPVLVYEKREEILDYLGYRHITGVGRWDSLAKARYLHELYELHHRKALEDSPNEVYKTLAKIIGSRSDYVQKLLRGFYLYQEIQNNGFYDISGLDDRTFSFSLLTTAISYANISNYLELQEDDDSFRWNYNARTLEELTSWMFKENSEGEKRIPESRSLKTLNSVLISPRALEVFQSNKPLEYASRFTDEPLELFQKAVEDSMRLIDVADSQFFLLENIPDSTVKSVSYLNTKAQDLWLKTKGRKELQ